MRVADKTLGIVVNASEWFERADFLAWLNDPDRRTATWHRPGEEPHDYSDVFVLIDSGHEGDSSDMPGDIWRACCDAAYAAHCNGQPVLHPYTTSHIIVRICNLD